MRRILLGSQKHSKVVSERLGHTSIGITSDDYSHAMPGMQKEAAKKIDEGLRKALADGRRHRSMTAPY